MNAEQPGLSPVAGPLTSGIHDQRIADLRARARRHDHGLLVVVGTRTGTRARVFLTMAGAQRAADNAERRGQPVVISLVRLAPVQTSPADLAALLAGVGE